MTETVSIEARDETFEVNVSIETGDEAIDVMVETVKAGTDLSNELVMLLPVESLARLYSAVVKEMDK